MESHYSVVYSQTLNPYLNLALEEWLLENLGPQQHLLFLWCNQPSVVMGRFQNPWVECNCEWLSENSILLVRRRSGGGCVYHDEGNLCFSLLFPYKFIDRLKNGLLLQTLLKTVGLPTTTLSERGDLLLGEKKFSGQAYLQKKDRSLHHGTFLIHSHLIGLQMALTPHYKGIVGPMIRSRRSPVMNLTELAPHLTKEKIQQTFHSLYPTLLGEQKQNVSIEVKSYSENDLHANPHIISKYLELSSSEWIWGETPTFEQIWALPELKNEGKWEVKKGLINHVEWQSETIHPSLVEEIGKGFLGQPYGFYQLEKIVKKYAEDYPLYQEELNQIMKGWKKNFFEI